MLNNLYKRNRFKVAFIALNLGGLARPRHTLADGPARQPLRLDLVGGNTQLFVFAIVS
ncbi:MAG: hypothetical protein KJ666_08735 [Bacteroidetes bacterium]|nr:hypothetical protein [Bacteroidota bacterium]